MVFFLSFFRSTVISAGVIGITPKGIDAHIKHHFFAATAD
jgi:hypothetical protein